MGSKLVLGNKARLTVQSQLFLLTQFEGNSPLCCYRQQKSKVGLIEGASNITGD